MDKEKKFGKKQKLFLLGIIGLILIGAGIYFYHAYYYPSTEDAYVNANIAYIAPQASGQVQEVAVVDHQEVKAGDVLFKIDPAPFQAALNQAQANLQVAKAQLIADQDQIQVSSANLAQAQANLVVTRKQTERTLQLLPQGYVSQSEADQATANLKSAQATVAGDQASLIKAKQNVVTQQSQIKAAEANAETAQLNLSYTTVTAPTSGTVGNLSLRPGMVVTSGVNLFAVVNRNEFWVDTNFEETKLKRVRVGQPAEVTLDMYPSVTFHGTVQSISAANGSTFSLLPAENATGNWVKITQRFTVRVLISASDLTEKYPLRVGASAEVVIDTN